MAEYSENDFILSLDNYLPDNSTEQISPKDVRDTFINAVDSSHRFLELHSIKALNIESAEYRQTRVGLNSLGNLDLPYESGSDNTAVGYFSMNGNVYGDNNTAVGSLSLSCNLDGDCNTAIGAGAIIGNVEGNGNVAIGNNTLSELRTGSYNIAIGLGAGHYIGPNDNYQFFLGSHPSGCDIECLDGSGTPLLRGDLEELKLAIGTNELHNYGTLQVSGDASPTLTRQFNLGNDNRAWKSINGQLQFPDSSTIKSTSDIIPCYDGLDLGTPELRWDGFFRDVEIYGNLTVNGDSVCPSGSGLQRFAEGFFIEDVPAPTDFCSPTSGLFTEKRTCDGVCEDGDTFYAVNRDVNLTIYNGTYAQFAKHGTEWRPIWVSCAPTNPVTTTTTEGPTTTTTLAPTTTTTCEPTTTSTTTTQEPTTTTTACPCAYTNCGCPDSPTINCPPSAPFFDCNVCGCVSSTTTTTTSEPTTTTTTTTIAPFGAAGCDALTDFSSDLDVADAIPSQIGTYETFASGAKSIFINTSFQGDSYNPSLSLYHSMKDRGNTSRTIVFPTVRTSCDTYEDLPDASGWGGKFMAIETDGQSVPISATNVGSISLSDFDSLVTSLNYATWPTNRPSVDNDSSSGVLILGYHDRCGSMTELSGIVAASSDIFYNFMRCNGVIWVRGAHTSGCLDVDNMNFVLKELLCESRFSNEEYIQLQGSSVMHTDNDIAFWSSDLYSFDLGGEGSISGGSKLCVPDASSFYVYDELSASALDLFGRGIDRSLNSGDPLRAASLSGNMVDPIFIHSGDINPSNSNPVSGQFLSSGVFTMVHEFTMESGYEYSYDECGPYTTWRCCMAPLVPTDCQLCDCASNRIGGRDQDDINALPDGCAKDDIQDAFDYYSANCPCPTTTTSTTTSTTTTTTTSSTPPPPLSVECIYEYQFGSWTVQSGGVGCDDESCDCFSNQPSDVELTNMWNTNGCGTLGNGDTINTSMECGACGHTYTSCTDI